MTSNSQIKRSKSVLLGAGFSKNFRGKLASEINSALLGKNGVPGNQRLQELLIKNKNFEDILGDLNAADDQFSYGVFKSAVVETFKEMEAEMSGFDFTPKLETEHPLSHFLLNLNQGMERSFIYTLNQDTFLEKRVLRPSANSWVIYPCCGVRHDECTPITGKTNDHAWSESGTHLIKLHGSMSWRTHDGDLVVMGSKKEDQIKRSELLESYQEHFARHVATSCFKLLVIGYGFGDAHVNSVLEDGIRNGMLLYCMDVADDHTQLNKIKSTLNLDDFSSLRYQNVSGDGFSEIFRGRHTDLKSISSPFIKSFIYD